MKTTLTFTAESNTEYDDLRKIKAVLKVNNYQIALMDIANNIFRPIRKHGYENKVINELCNNCGVSSVVLIGALEEMFYEILNENGLDMEELL